MSIKAAAAVLDVRDEALTVAERYVLLIYAVRAREDSDPRMPLMAWPTAVRLAEETGLTREHVQRCRAILTERGLIQRTGMKKGRSDVYQLDLSVILALGKCDVTSHRPVMSHHTERTGKEQGKEQPPKAPTEPHGFREFYETYPRHVAKGAALRAWAKAVKKTEPEVIIAGAKRYAEDPSRDQSFTAYPATWLNQERWDDDPLPPRRGGQAFRDTNQDHWHAGGTF